MPNPARRLALITVVILGIVAGGVGVASGPAAAVQTDTSGFVDVDPADLPGSGTKNDPYVITNASELQAMEDDLDAYYELGADINASGTSTWSNGAGFDPIGGSSGEFGGQFDGNHHTITQLTIDRNATEDVGLFGKTDGARIASVRLSNVTVYGGDNVGGLAGQISEDSVVRNVTASVSVAGVNDTGGISGDLEDSSAVWNTSVRGTVTGSDNVGGIVGSNVGGLITVSSSRASITATGKQRAGDTARGGGIVGGNYNGGIINQSYVLGAVSAGRAGGITGENFQSSRVINSYAAGQVSGRTSSQTGGVVGGNFRNSTVSDSYWDRQTTGQATSAGNATGLTTAQMTGQAARSNMSGLEFGTVWAARANDYPVLIGVGAPSQQPQQVFTQPLPGSGAQAPPTNLDSDSLYEDINGDGQGTFQDAIALAFVQTSGLTQAQKDALDHDGDGDVDFDDAIDLAFDPAIV